MSHSFYTHARLGAVGLALAIVLTSGAVTVPAYAAGRGVEALPSQVVRYGDLDLATEQGQQRLKRRVRGAVKAVCDNKSVDLTGRALDRYCLKTAWIAAQAQMASILEGKSSGTLAAAAITISAVGR